MGIQIAVIAFSTKGSAGVSVISGIVDKLGAAFTPKVVKFFGVGGGTPSVYSYVINGHDDGVTRWGAVSAADEKARTGTAFRSGYNTRDYSLVYTSLGVASGVIRAAKITALASGSFTLTYDLDFAVETMYAIVFGGSDLQHTIGHTAGFSSNTSRSITGAGYTPTCAFWHRGNHEAVAGTTFGDPGLGWATGAFNQGSVAIDERGYVSPSQTARYQRTTLCGAYFNGTANGIRGTIEHQSFDADGETIYGTTDAGLTEWDYLWLGGVSAYASADIQRVGTGAQVLLTPGVLPLAALILSVGGIPHTAIQPDASFSMGAGDGTRQYSVWTGNQTGINPDDPTRYNNSSSVWAMMTPTSAGAGTVTTQAAITSFSDGQINLNVSIAATIRPQLLYLALGVPSSTPTTDTGNYGHQSPPPVWGIDRFDVKPRTEQTS